MVDLMSPDGRMLALTDRPDTDKGTPGNVHRDD